MKKFANEPFIVLLVEDDEGHAQLVRKHLQRAGVLNPILHLPGGAPALSHLSRPDGKPDRDRMVMVLDLNLPDIDGFEVLRRLKADPGTKDIPVIVLSTTNDQNDIDLCYALGCNVFLTKPLAYEDFARAIEKLDLALTTVRVPHMKP